jgi:hypothetical protein
MAKCHQCFTDLGTGQRNGDCKVCHAKGVDFCQRCAMWELGPMDAEDDVLPKLRKAKEVLLVPRQDRDKSSSSVGKHGDEPLACDVFLPLMGEVCPFIEDQLKNAKATLYEQPFKDYACKVLDKFQELYPTCKYDRVALQVLLVMYLSSQERVQCRTVKDSDGHSESAAAKPVKRWQTREIAVTHLTAHLDAVKDTFGDKVHGLVSKATWLKALGLDDLEFYLKGFKHGTLMAIDLGGGADAREVVEIGVILYHALTAARTKAEVKGHWSSKRPNFTSKEALGFLSEDHFKVLYGDVSVAKAFSDGAKAAINRLWLVLNDDRPENALPSHPRYRDDGVGGNGLLTTVEQHYLQYLPALDHPEGHEDLRTPCEKKVRARVARVMKEYRKIRDVQLWYKDPELTLDWQDLDATTGSTKKLKIEETQRGGEIAPVDVTFTKSGMGNVPTAITTTEMGKITSFVQSLLAADDLRRFEGKVKIRISGEVGNDRRKARRAAVEKAVRDEFDRLKAKFSHRLALVGDDGQAKALDEQAFLDDVIAKMKSDFCVDQAFDCGVSTMILDRAKLDRTFEPKAWFPLKLTPVKYAELFPDCGFSGAVELFTIDEHYEDIEGSSPRPAHYMDWRNHKDHWLYDCFAILKKRRPVFGSLSGQPILPEPNSNYGGHILYYKRTAIDGRCVFTFGDKQQPRRSMLLLLDTILFGRKKKDGAEAQKPAGRQKVLFEFVQRYEQILELGDDHEPDELWQMTFARDKTPYTDGDHLIECQIFGGIDLTRDAWGFVPAHEDGASPYYVKKNHLTSDDLGAAKLKLASVYPHVVVLPYKPSEIAGRKSAQNEDPQRAALFVDVEAAG